MENGLPNAHNVNERSLVHDHTRESVPMDIHMSCLAMAAMNIDTGPLAYLLEKYSVSSPGIDINSLTSCGLAALHHNHDVAE